MQTGPWDDELKELYSEVGFDEGRTPSPTAASVSAARTPVSCPRILGYRTSKTT